MDKDRIQWEEIIPFYHKMLFFKDIIAEKLCNTDITM